MARNYSSDEASEIGRWHLALLSRLKSASSTSPDGYRADIRTASNELTENGYYAKSFLEEALNGIDPLSDKAGLAALVTRIYRYKRFSELSRTCNSLLNAHQAEIERLLKELEPAYKGFTWNFLPARTKMTAESACARLKELGESQYAASATSALDEMDLLHSIMPDEAWADFLGDKIGYRLVFFYILQIINIFNPFAEIDALIKEAENLGRCIANVKAAPSTMIPEVKKASDEMAAARAVEMLCDTPIEDITRQKQGIKAKVLRDCGYETIGKLRGLSAEEIASTTGLGWRAASDVVGAVKSLEGIAAKSARIKLSIDSKTPEATRLICALYDVAEARRIADGISESDRIVGKLLSKRTATLKEHSNIGAWPFWEAAERRETIEAYRSVNELFYSQPNRPLKPGYPG